RRDKRGGGGARLAWGRDDEVGDEHADHREDHAVEHRVLHDEVRRDRDVNRVLNALERRRPKQRGRPERAPAGGIIDQEPDRHNGGADDTSDDSLAEVAGVGGHGEDPPFETGTGRRWGPSPYPYHQRGPWASDRGRGHQARVSREPGSILARELDT